MSVEGGPDIVTNGLVLYLDAANNRSIVSGSTTWFDLSRNGNTGSLINGPTFSSANGGSIVFDGNDDYVNANLPSIDFENISLSCWVNFSNISKNYQNFISLGANPALIASNSDTQNYNFGYYSTIKWHVNTRLNSTWASELSVNVNAPVNNAWYNGVATFSTTGSTRKIYINGVYIGGDSNYNNPSTVTFVRIGGGAFGWAFAGAISMPMIYNRELSAAEIRQNYHATKGRYGL